MENFKQSMEDELTKLKTRYKFSDTASEDHVKFLQFIDDNEDKRLNTIELKLSQIIGQSGVIFAIIAFFTPLFFKELSDLFIALKVLFCLLFVGGFVCFAYSIIKASDTLSIHKFRYSRPSVKNALTEKNRSKPEFLEESVRDLVTSIQNNTNLNSMKGQLLIDAHRSFIIGFVLIGSLTMMLTALSLFYKPRQDTFVFEKSTNVELLENTIYESKAMISIMSRRQLAREDSILLQRIDQKMDSLARLLPKKQNKIRH